MIEHFWNLHISHVVLANDVKLIFGESCWLGCSKNALFARTRGSGPLEEGG